MEKHEGKNKNIFNCAFGIIRRDGPKIKKKNHKKHIFFVFEGEGRQRNPVGARQSEGGTILATQARHWRTPGRNNFNIWGIN